MHKINNMENNKMTAVEWLEEIYLTTGIDRNVHFNQAKEMEKEQIVQAYEYTAIGTSHYGEQYYKETFKSE